MAYTRELSFDGGFVGDVTCACRARRAPEGHRIQGSVRVGDARGLKRELAGGEVGLYFAVAESAPGSKLYALERVRRDDDSISVCLSEDIRRAYRRGPHGDTPLTLFFWPANKTRGGKGRVQCEIDSVERLRPHRGKLLIDVPRLRSDAWAGPGRLQLLARCSDFALELQGDLSLSVRHADLCSVPVCVPDATRVRFRYQDRPRRAVAPAPAPQEVASTRALALGQEQRDKDALLLHLLETVAPHLLRHDPDLLHRWRQGRADTEARIAVLREYRRRHPGFLDLYGD